MKLRRVSIDGVLSVQGKGKQGWISFERVAKLNTLLQLDNDVPYFSNTLLSILNLDVANLTQLQSEIDELAPVDGENYSAVLPFSPASFRDFMLYEKHMIDASRGYAKRFLPSVFPIIQFVEKLMGKPFKKFKPHALWYKQPIYYLGNHMNFGVSGDDVAWPEFTNALDYELELGAVITKPLLNATAEQAVAAIGGFVVLNDLSARDIQKEEMDSGFGPQKTKHFYSTISSVVVTADELLPYIDSLSASVIINGVQVSGCHSSGMQFSLGEAISFASKSEQLHPGEFFGTGTFPGGGGMENGHWLKPGDTVTLKIDRIGEVTNRIQGVV